MAREMDEEKRTKLKEKHLKKSKADRGQYAWETEEERADKRRDNRE